MDVGSSKVSATRAVLTGSPDGVPSTDSAFAAELSDLLVSTYGSIDALESRLLNAGHGLDVSLAESRLLDIVGRSTLHGRGEITVSGLAEAAGIRVPSATAAVGRMVAKGLLSKRRNERDARCVNLLLTRDGERVYRLHVIFHKRMAETIAGDMTEEERATLLAGVRRLEHFYAQAKEM